MRIAPSILSADFANLEAELATISSADLIHVDVMDGHFVPNLTIGLPVVARLQQVTTVPLDVHLMIEQPEIWAAKYAETGAFSVTFHLEAAKNPTEVISQIRSAGAKVGIAIKPGTAFEEVSSLLAQIDMLLVMTVEPGFGGQGLIQSVIPKVSQARDFIIQNGLQVSIQVDGGVGVPNISSLALAGADTFVAGSAVFSEADRNNRIDQLRVLAESM
ncbi:MAG: ribulose-phosphate 3-epimerase [Actinomycetota bacterium]|jgi:ribulose-phosphate 3-epimerase